MNNLFESHGVDNRPDLRNWFMQQKCHWMLGGASGDFYWATRMGSGWEPRSDKCQALKLGDGPCQVTEGGISSSHDQSLPKFRFPVWNFFAVLKELAPLDITNLNCATTTTVKPVEHENMHVAI